MLTSGSCLAPWVTPEFQNLSSALVPTEEQCLDSLPPASCLASLCPEVPGSAATGLFILRMGNE